MARGRVIDKEIYSHEKLMGLSIETRYFYQGLIIWADDDGRLKANPKYLKAKIFPGDTIQALKIRSMLSELAAIGCLVLYKSGDEDEFLQHSKWEKWQTVRKDRYRPSRYPSSVDGVPVVNQGSTDGSPVLVPVLVPYSTLPYSTSNKDKAKPEMDAFSPKDLKELWNNTIDSNLPHLKELPETRVRKIKEHLKLRPKREDWENIIRIVNASDFLTGKIAHGDKKPFICTFDWIIKPANLTKVVEGNYTQKTKPKSEVIG